MANVQFEDQGIYTQYASNTDRRPTMVRWLINWGVAEDEKSANYILIGIMGLAFLLSVFIIYKTISHGESKPEVIPDVVKNMQLPPIRR